MTRIQSLAAVILGLAALGGSALVAADEIGVENTSNRSFYYSLHDARLRQWTNSLEVPPGERRTHKAEGRVQISYLSDRPHFAWLEAGKTYRITDVSRGQLRVVTEARRPTLPRRSDSPQPRPQPPNLRPAVPSVEEMRGAAAETESDTTDSLDSLVRGLPRDVSVIVVADRAYRNSVHNWRDRVENVVSGASAYYQREFGLRLMVEKVRAWDYTAITDTLDERWDMLLRVSPGDADMVIAFVGFGGYVITENGSGFAGQLGRAAFFGQHVTISDRPDVHENRPKTVLIHELGHIFGAFHVPGQQLIMYPGYTQLPTQDIISGKVPFGATLHRLVQLTRVFDFGRGVASLSPEVQRHIQETYRLHGLPNEASQTDPITQGYEYLATRARIRAEEMSLKADESRLAFGVLAD